MFPENTPIAFWTAIDEFFWFINDKRVFAIPIPAINMALIDTSDRNCEKLSTIRLMPPAEFSGYLNLTLFWSLNKLSTLLMPSLLLVDLLNLTLYS